MPYVRPAINFFPGKLKTKTMSTAKNIENKTDKVEVVLIAEHTHGDKDYQAGDAITVSQAQHEWLRQQGKVE